MYQGLEILVIVWCKAKWSSYTVIRKEYSYFERIYIFHEIVNLTQSFLNVSEEPSLFLFLYIYSGIDTTEAEICHHGIICLNNVVAVQKKGDARTLSPHMLKTMNAR
jgi:hypothetical protein